MTTGLPPSLAANPRLSTWLAPHPDGTFDLRVGKVELGQGIVTALTQIATQELGLRAGAVRPVAANTEISPDEGVTAGSLSVTFSGAAVRRASAEVRLLFLRAAAARSGVSPDEITFSDGTFAAPGGRPYGYGDLVDNVDLDIEAGDEALAVAFLPIGEATSMSRVDLPDKIFGRPRFIHDLTFDEMLHARIVRPPGMGAHLLGAPVDEVAGLPGVEHIVRDHDFLAVLATREGLADRAAARLAAGATWTDTEPLPDSSRLPDWIRSQETESSPIRKDGAVHGTGSTTMSRTYSKPFVAHGSIAPSCGIARFAGGRLEVWSHSQGIFPLRAATARALGLEVEDVIVQHVEGAGCYGHNSADDAAFDAALIATHVPGRHVRVQWSRADELRWEPFGPAMIGDVTATVGDNGRVSDWTYDASGNGHTARPGYAPAHGLLSDAHRAGVDRVPPAIDPPPARGYGSARNAEPTYDFARMDITTHRLLAMPIRSSALRSLGAHLNVFALESFMDEIAEATGQDPLAFRLAHLTDPRARDVLTTVAEAAGWGSPTAEGVGRGISYSRYKNRGSYCAVIAEVEAEEAVHVTRLTIAVDVGRVVNDDGVRNQIEGGAIQSTSWSLLEQVAFDRSRITSTDWEAYPILRFSDAPRVDVHIVSRPDEPPLGAGEATQGPVPGAIANAIHDAIGVRVRNLPFTPANVVAAIDEA
ncbi:MAG: xanthine dehydrogenase family protein molybdopterin-binding subunit [Aeromicrobium sp.]|nr:xanthine dehydrogenase family protein molybdopterin-binding subunit [Aeromicrobium sp.]